MKILAQDFTYDLPQELVANEPVSPRDHSNLMVVDRKTSELCNKKFYNLPDLLSSNDVLVLNETKVFPARVYGKKTTGGRVELLLLRPFSPTKWEVMSKPGLKKGQSIVFTKELKAEVIESSNDKGTAKIIFNQIRNNLLKTLNSVGETPIPPYINPSQNREDLKKSYQTVYAKDTGSSAAPTAGLHFTNDLLFKLKKKGVEVIKITLHVGLGTFQKVRQDQIETGRLHCEFYEISEESASALNTAKNDGKRIIAVGTTSARTLESAVKKTGDRWQIVAGENKTELFIYPPYKLKFVDSLITNFHLPNSSLLMLVSALVSKPNTNVEFTSFRESLIMKAYQKAIEEKYRFYSFGDAMFIV